jgi:hypothetical protein
MSIATEIELPTAAGIAALFREHDVIPEQLVYLALPDLGRPKCRACAIGILLVELRGSAAAARADCRFLGRTIIEQCRRSSGLPREFIAGLDDGFTASDGSEIDHEISRFDGCHPLYIEGYRVGWDAWVIASGRQP